MGSKRASHAAVVLPGPRVLVMGGHDGSSSPLNTAELYDPQSQTWSAVPPMGSKRSGLAAVVLPGPRVLVMGGQDGHSDLNTAELYELVELS